MNLKHLTDDTLHSETHRVHREHQTLLIQLLHHLRENERRRLFSAYKYPSLFAYVIGELKYSEDEAARRISAMRLLRDVPDIEEKITSGELSLTNMVMAQSLFSKERKAGRPMALKQKREVLSRLENQPVRVAQRVLAEINPEIKPKKDLDFDSIDDEVLRERLLKLKGALAHSNPNMTLSELLHKICDIAEEQIAIKEPIKTSTKITKAKVQREVWTRDESKCSKCGSTHAVQEDHRIPEAVGGKFTVENIRLLCRSCNQRSAIEFYGIEKMEKYIDGAIKSPAAPRVIPKQWALANDRGDFEGQLSVFDFSN
jgi:5-methylcytosine-specific restriction endonuclease McrA